MKKIFFILLTLLASVSIMSVKAAAADISIEIDSEGNITSSTSGYTFENNVLNLSGRNSYTLKISNPDVSVTGGGTINADSDVACKLIELTSATISGGTYDTDVIIHANASGASAIEGGHFKKSVTLTADDVCRIKDGTFDGPVTIGNKSKEDFVRYQTEIYSGTFNGTVTNYALISGGIFNGEVNNYGRITINTNSEDNPKPKFTSVVNNLDGGTGLRGNISYGEFTESSELHNYGDITNATLINSGYLIFGGTVINETGGKISIRDNPDTPAEFVNNGIIESGDFSDINIINNGTIKGGVFKKVTNYGVIDTYYSLGQTSFKEIINETKGEIKSGTFSDKLALTNNGTISGGDFVVDFTNYGNITGGSFNGTLKNEGIINIKPEKYDKDNFSNVINKSSGEIKDGFFSDPITLKNHGTISGGKFECLVDCTGESEPSARIISNGLFLGGLKAGETDISGGIFKLTSAPAYSFCSITGGYFNETAAVGDGFRRITLSDNCKIDCDGIDFAPVYMAEGASVTFIADAPKSGMLLTGWEIVTDGDLKVSPVSSSGLSCTVRIPSDNITVKPVYSSTPIHTHSYSDEWVSDSTAHWHECSCGAKSGYEEHIPEAFEAVEPTCTKDGCSSGEKCSVCGYIISAQEIIPAKGHGETEVRNAVEATADKDGYTGDVYCKVCGEKIKDGEIIPAKGHPGTPVAPSVPSYPTVNPSSYPAKDKWETAMSEISRITSGTVTIDMRDGKTVIPAEILALVKGKNIDLVLNMGNGNSWTINGESVEIPKSVDMGIRKGTSNIPASVLNTVTGERFTVQMSLKYDGEFGFFAELSVDLGSRNDGRYADLYYYNEKSKEMEIIDSSEIIGGKAGFVMSHASEYAIVISDKPAAENIDSAAGISDMSETAESGNTALTVVIMLAAAAFAVKIKKAVDKK